MLLGFEIDVLNNILKKFCDKISPVGNPKKGPVTFTKDFLGKNPPKFVRKKGLKLPFKTIGSCNSPVHIRVSIDFYCYL